MANNKKIKILVVSHKDFDDKVLPDGYQVIKVGSGISNAAAISRGWLSDEMGENIAAKNPYYCELTAYYWAWKNLIDVDYVGISHYRRFFMDYKSNTTTFWENVIRVEKISSIFKRYKAIMPYWEKKVGDWLYLHEDSKKEQNPDLSVLREIISSDYPAVLTSFDKVTRGTVLNYANMCVLSLPDFKAYSSFLFDVLKKYDEIIKVRDMAYPLRIDGYLSETLLPVWVSYKYKESEIYRTDVMNSEQQGWTCKTLLGRLRVFHPVLSIVRKMQLWLSK